MKKNDKLKMFFLALGLTIVDLLIPDPLPFIDEIVLGLWTTIAGFKLIK
ncbi:MAG: hypothetical protein KKF48_02575 [Nanoarchaeota archaeon]|nr:hypothetical protein [Nanoarchaeota archaeon]